MTGNELLAEFDGIAANDLDPLATTTAAKLALLNIAARRVMHLLKIIRRSVPLAYVSGTTRYNLRSLSTPLDEANRVRLNNVDYPRSSDADGKGWSQVDDFIDIFFTAQDGNILYIDGYQSSLPIVASTTQITDVPADLHLAVVQLAIVEGCVAHEDDPGQLTRLQRLERTALDKINRRVGKNASTAFAFINSRT
jgi:hypothetical protein